ncbi:AEC family transporter [Amycolatopsis sp. H20-H5]|uniref:AEC family transporter n=1 Tax=Amycolatopsis sp. H20-H5 TaxID=3046309 RepID=UPI002DBA2057|nr:AEC family transporter [Amycolatopsis sp. H20-H5]MEC3982425.1 AEC family transporter [Amycolatopsis sp. H20-H5]
MTGTLSAFTPIWVLTGLGYLLSRFSVLGDRADQVLTRFAFLVAMPAVLFGTLLDTPFSALVNPGLIAFGVGTGFAGVAGFVLARWVFRRGFGDGAVTAMAASYVNAANLGIPVALQVLGSSSFIVTVLLFQSLVMMSSLLAMLESDVDRGGTPRWRALISLPIRNPVIAASLLGVLVGTSGWRPPEVVLQPLHTLGNAGVATALLVLGMSLNASTTDAPGPAAGPGRRWEVLAVVALKVAVQPAVALGAGLLLGLPEPLLFAAVLCSALPTAQNVFIATSQYAIDTRFVRDCVLGSTVVSMGSLSLIALLLG